MATMITKRGPMRLTALAALTVGAAVLTAGCDKQDETPLPEALPPVTTPAPEAAVAPAVPATPAVAAGGDVKVADIASGWTNYVGQTVTVVADVEEVKGPRAFTLDEDSALTGGVDDDLLVLSPQAGSLASIDDQWLDNKVRVTGVVHRFVTVDIEREIGWDLDPKLEADFDGKRPVLIATAIERVER